MVVVKANLTRFAEGRRVVRDQHLSSSSAALDTDGAAKLLAHAFASVGSKGRQTRISSVATEAGTREAFLLLYSSVKVRVNHSRFTTGRAASKVKIGMCFKVFLFFNNDFI